MQSNTSTKRIRKEGKKEEEIKRNAMLCYINLQFRGYWAVEVYVIQALLCMWTCCRGCVILVHVNVCTHTQLLEPQGWSYSRPEHHSTSALTAAVLLPGPWGWHDTDPSPWPLFPGNSFPILDPPKRKAGSQRCIHYPSVFRDFSHVSRFQMNFPFLEIQTLINCSQRRIKNPDFFLCICDIWLPSWKRRR